MRQQRDLLDSGLNLVAHLLLLLQLHNPRTSQAFTSSPLGIVSTQSYRTAATNLIFQLCDSRRRCTATEMVAAPLSQVVEPDTIRDAPLLRDVEMLSDMLAEVVDRDSPKVHDLYTRFRRHGLNRSVEE